MPLQIGSLFYTWVVGEEAWRTIWFKCSHPQNPLKTMSVASYYSKVSHFNTPPRPQYTHTHSSGELEVFSEQCLLTEHFQLCSSAEGTSVFGQTQTTSVVHSDWFCVQQKSFMDTEQENRAQSMTTERSSPFHLQPQQFRYLSQSIRFLSDGFPDLPK